MLNLKEPTEVERDLNVDPENLGYRTRIVERSGSEPPLLDSHVPSVGGRGCETNGGGSTGSPPNSILACKLAVYTSIWPKGT